MVDEIDDWRMDIESAQVVQMTHFEAPTSVRRLCRSVGFLLLLAVVAGAAYLPLAWAGEYVTKFACVAPEGSLWVKLTREWDRELRQETRNRARIQLFPGGILGEEFDAIRKIRAGQIQATGVTGIGMGALVPETRVFELPRLFRSVAEIDAARERLLPYYEEAFEKRGYVLMGFTEVGPIHLFTRAPATKLEDLYSQRMWVWESDPISEALSKVFDISAVPLSLLNVRPSLQTGVIDAVYGSPLAVVTMQWHNYLRFMSAEPVAYGMGVIALDKRHFDALPPDIQAIQKRLGAKYTRLMVEQARVDNQRAVLLMKQHQVQTFKLGEGQEALLDERARVVWRAVEGKLFSPELLQQVEAVTLEIRNAKQATH